MADVAFEGGAESIGVGVDNLTFNYTCSSNSNRCLIVTTYSGNTGTDVCDGITYNGVSMTQTGTIDGGRTQMYELANPASGSNEMIVSFAASGNVAALISDYSSVDQTTPVDGFNSSFSVNGVTITSEVGDMCVYQYADAAGATTVTPDKTQIAWDYTGVILIESEYAVGAANVTFNPSSTGENNPRNIGANLNAAAAGTTSALTGTVTASVTETAIVTGSKTIILTLTDDTFVAAGTGPIGSTADTQALIDGLTSAQVEGTGWNAEVRDKEVTSAVVRTSDTVATITLTAQAAYNITAQETITATIPAAVLVTSSIEVVTTPTFTIDVAGAASITGVDSPVLDAETGNSLTTSDYGSDINDITIQDVAVGTYEVDVSGSIGGSAGNWTFDMPDVAAFAIDTLGTTFNSSSHTHTITASDGIDSDTAAIVVNPKSGWAVIEITGAVKTTGSVFKGWTGTPVDTDQVYYPTADTTAVDATGILTTDKVSGTIDMVFFDTTDDKWKPFTIVVGDITAVLTGTVTASIIKADIIAGGKTIILTLTNDTFAATLGADNSITDALIAGIDSGQAEVAGWDAVVKANMVFGDIVRTSDTVCTITLAAEATYDVTAQETITVTIPAVALTDGTSEVIVSPTFVISVEANALVEGSLSLLGAGI